MATIRQIAWLLLLTREKIRVGVVPPAYVVVTKVASNQISREA
jgi:hypothetical protein